MSYIVKWYPFEIYPESNSCRSLSTGPDGDIYIASYCENSPGHTAKILKYNERTDSLDYLFDSSDIIKESTQCSVISGFTPSKSDKIMYILLSYKNNLTHGSVLTAYNKNCVLWSCSFLKDQGARSLLHDEDNDLLYTLSYPRNHLIVFDIQKKTAKDLGRIGSVNSDVLFMDSRHRIWTANDYGNLISYDPAERRLKVSPHILPYNPDYQTGWHNILHDAVEAHDEGCIYAVTGNVEPHLIRFYPDEGEWGKIEDLGVITQDRDNTFPYNTFLDHCGGLVYGGDNQLYYVSSRWRDPVYNPTPVYQKKYEGVLFRMDTNSLEKEELITLDRPDNFAHHISRGAVDNNGNLFFGNVGQATAGIFKVDMPIKIKNIPLRMWG